MTHAMLVTAVVRVSTFLAHEIGQLLQEIWIELYGFKLQERHFIS